MAPQTPPGQSVDDLITKMKAFSTTYTDLTQSRSVLDDLNDLKKELTASTPDATKVTALARKFGNDMLAVGESVEFNMDQLTKANDSSGALLYKRALEDLRAIGGDKAVADLQKDEAAFNAKDKPGLQAAQAQITDDFTNAALAAAQVTNPNFNSTRGPSTGQTGIVVTGQKTELQAIEERADAVDRASASLTTPQDGGRQTQMNIKLGQTIRDLEIALIAERDLTSADGRKAAAAGMDHIIQDMEWKKQYEHFLQNDNLRHNQMQKVENIAKQAKDALTQGKSAAEVKAIMDQLVPSEQDKNKHGALAELIGGESVQVAEESKRNSVNQGLVDALKAFAGDTRDASGKETNPAKGAQVEKLIDTDLSFRRGENPQSNGNPVSALGLEFALDVEAAVAKSRDIIKAGGSAIGLQVPDAGAPRVQGGQAQQKQ